VCKYYEIKGKTKTKYHNVVTIPNFNRTIAEIEAKSTHLIENIHDRSLSWLGTGTSITSGGIKLVLWSQILF
jgi:hypothetical protein